MNCAIAITRNLSFASLFLVLVITAAHADMVWPALYLENRLVSVWVIAAGFLVEWLFMFFAFRLPVLKSLIVTAVMNAASAVVGIAAIPLAGVLWELFPGSIMYLLFHTGTFNPVTWVATFFLATLVTTAIEALVVRYGFKISLGKRRLAYLGAANTASVGIAFISFIFWPPPNW